MNDDYSDLSSDLPDEEDDLHTYIDSDGNTRTCNCPDGTDHEE